jgi:D-amino-acid dehydrogenase
VAGLRPVTPDGLPILGISARWENVCLATGAGRKGMLLGAALGLAASELVVGGTTGLPIAACDLGRPGARG